jgi:hypothetical protein
VIKPYKTTASDVRTGHIIAFPDDNYRRTIDVEHTTRYVRHSTGHVTECDCCPGSFCDRYRTSTSMVAFTGWAGDERIVDGWDRYAGSEVLVMEDRRLHCFGVLSGELPAVDEVL